MGLGHLLDRKTAKNISPMIRRGVKTILGIHGNPQGNPHGNPQGNPMTRVKPEKIIAQTNKAKRMPNRGDPSSKGALRPPRPQSSLERIAEPQPLQ